MVEKMKRYSIYGLRIKYFIPMALILLFSIRIGALNSDVVGTLAFLAIGGGFFSWFGERIPVLGKWLGGSILLPIIVGAALQTFGLIPKSLSEQVNSFFTSGMTSILIGAVIVGSILSINRNTLKRIFLMLIPSLLITSGTIILGMFLACKLTGKSVWDGVYMTGLPNFCGGTSASLVAIPEIYAELFGKSPSDYSGRLVMLLNISNILSIAFAGLLNNFGKKLSRFTGYGQLLKKTKEGKSESLGIKSVVNEEKKENDSRLSAHYEQIGCITSVSLLVVGALISAFLPLLNYIAWTAIVVIVLKLGNFFDEEICMGSGYWQDFMIRIFVPPLIFAVGITSIDLFDMAKLLTFSNLFIIFAGIISALLGALISAAIFHLHPIDAMIAIGCNFGTLGGSGTIAVLSTAERMELMPYATIVGRIGGAFMLIILSLTAVFFV